MLEALSRNPATLPNAHKTQKAHEIKLLTAIFVSRYFQPSALTASC